MQREYLDPVKFHPPGIPFGFTVRPRLARCLTDGAPARLIVLLAPPGFGKTSLLASVARDWARSERANASPLAWYSLDASDDDAAVFVEGVVRAIREVSPGVGKNTLAVLRGVPDARAELPRLMSVLAREIKDAGDTDVYLALDDFQRLADKAILQCVDQISKDTDSPLRLIISTEAELPFYLSTLRAQRLLVEVSRDDLLLTREEVEGLMRARSRGNLDGSLVENVTREAHGWASATALAAAIVVPTGRPLPFSRVAPTEHGYTQLLRHLLASLPPDVKDGIVRSSLLSVLAPDALTVAGVKEPERILRAVEHLALPAAPVSEEGEAIRYDPVLRAALGREFSAATSAQDVRSIEKSIASYYAARGLWDMAVSEYAEGWAHEDAAAFVEGAADDELALGHIDTVLKWLRAIPSVTRKGRPRLMVLEARALLARGDVAGARVLLTTAEPDLTSAQDWSGLGGRTATWGRVQFHDGRYKDAARTAGEALSRLDQDRYPERADALYLWSRAEEMLGNLPDASAAAAAGLLMAERSGRNEPVVRALAQLSALAELRGDYSEALALSGRAVQRSTLGATEDLGVMAGGFIAGSVYVERDQPGEAAAVANLMAGAAERLQDPSGALRARLLLAQADVEGSGRPSGWKANTTPSVSENTTLAQTDRLLELESQAASMFRHGKRKDGLKLAQEALGVATAIAHRPSILRCELQIAAASTTGDTIRGALRLVRVRGLRDALLRSDSRRWLAAAQSMVGLGYVRLGIRWRAKRNLERSLDLAAREGYVGMPLRLPIRAERLLTFAVRHDVKPELAGALLGVGPARGRKLLAPLLGHKNFEIRARAEKALKGMETGEGRAPLPRVTWPDLDDGAGGSPIALQTLGGMTAIVAATRLDWPSDDARDLAAYFVVNRGACIQRETLLRDVWPDVAEAEALVRLHVALYRIREGLGPGYPRPDILAESTGQYCWDGAGCPIDVEHFRILMERLDQSMPPHEAPTLPGPTLDIMEEALAVYQGEFLDGIQFPWCHEQREELRSRLLMITRLLIDHYMAGRQWREAIRCGLKSLRSDPLQEGVVRDLMLCYFRIGDRASVLGQYREVKRLLARERGAWPSDETRQLRVRLLGK